MEKQNKIKKMLFTILSWLYVGFAALLTIGLLNTENSTSVIMMFISMILALPIAPIQKIWNTLLLDNPEKKILFKKIKQNKMNMKILKPWIIGCFFCLAFLMATEKISSESTNLIATTEETTLASTDLAATTEETTLASTDLVTTTEEAVETVDVTQKEIVETQSSIEESVEVKTEEPTKIPEPVTENVVSTATPIVNISPVITLSDIPAYSGKAYVEINNNVPYFDDSELTTSAFETYSSLDSLGRCGIAYANICKEIMPTEERGNIGSVKPTGWHTVKYDCVDGKYLYNRCHLIGFQLAGENANNKNLITGTRYMNVDGMLPFENMVADYVKETNNHVLYKITPIFDGDNLIASGVLMEAKSVEDNGDGILFNVYCYNNQPGVSINYADGTSQLDGTVVASTTEQPTKTPTTPIVSSEPIITPAPAEENTSPTESGAYAVNVKNGKIHMVGECAATGNGSSAMNNPIYFKTFEDAETYSISDFPNLDKRQCGNCW